MAGMSVQLLFVTEHACSCSNYGVRLCVMRPNVYYLRLLLVLEDYTITSDVSIGTKQGGNREMPIFSEPRSQLVAPPRTRREWPLKSRRMARSKPGYHPKWA